MLKVTAPLIGSHIAVQDHATIDTVNSDYDDDDYDDKRLIRRPSATAVAYKPS